MHARHFVMPPLPRHKLPSLDENPTPLVDCCVVWIMDVERPRFLHRMLYVVAGKCSGRHVLADLLSVKRTSRFGSSLRIIGTALALIPCAIIYSLHAVMRFLRSSQRGLNTDRNSRLPLILVPRI